MLACFAKSSKQWQLKLNQTSQEYYKNNTVSYEYEMTELVKDKNKYYNKKGEVIQNMLLGRSWGFDSWDIPNMYGHKDVARGIMETTNWKSITERFKYRSDKVNAWHDDTGDCQSLSFAKKSFASSFPQINIM